ncbi:unnamed protein product [Gordionus sp. m RMFG-2023]
MRKILLIPRHHPTCAAITESSLIAVSPMLLLPVSAPALTSGLSFAVLLSLIVIVFPTSIAVPCRRYPLRHIPRFPCITYWSLNVTPRVALIPCRIRILESTAGWHFTK